MDQAAFLEEIAWRAGHGDAARAARSAEVVLAAFAEELSPDEARALAHALPGPLAAHVLAGPKAPSGRAPSADLLYRRVSEREGTPLGFAIEHVRIVLGALAGRLPETTLVRLRRHLSPTFDELLTPRPAPQAPPVHAHHAPLPEPGQGTTLASGRPGSRHPLSEARPERAHAESVARADNPHADVKLSSSAGLTQEREHETLAEGHPGPSRPVTEKGR